MADEPRPHYYSDTPPVEPAQSGGLPRWLLPALGVAFALVSSLVLYRGCGVEPVATSRPDEVARATENPWPSVLTDLRRQSDAAGCRATLDRVDDALTLNKSPDLQPASLSPESASALRASLELTEPELNELRPANYTPLDAQYLADRLYLREAARSLDASKRPPLEQAGLAFDLVNRQVAERPWLRLDAEGRGQLMPPVPPVDVLNRGGGTSYERGLTFLALARQFGLDGCFVGASAAANRAFGESLDPQSPFSGPMWGVGVRVGADIYLYDPVRRLPFPAPGGKPATLAQLQADLGLLKPWRDDKVRPWTVPDADVKGAAVYPVVELSALAPRMARLEAELRPDAPAVPLYEEWPKLVARFSAPGRVVAAWNPNQPFTPLRTLSSFLPAKEGGFSPAPDLPEQLVIALIPPTLLARDSPAAAVERLRLEVVSRYGSAFVQPPSPTERIARGQFSEVVPTLVARLGEYQAAQDRLRADRDRDPAAVGAFLAALNGVEAKKRLARDKERDLPGPLTLEARQAEADLYKSAGKAAGALVDASLAEVGAAEATFLIALAMHEQAERAQTRVDRGAGGADREAAAAARRAWAEASGWWKRYAPYATAANANFPGRAQQVAGLRARAEKLAG